MFPQDENDYRRGGGRRAGRGWGGPPSRRGGPRWGGPGVGPDDPRLAGLTPGEEDPLLAGLSPDDPRLSGCDPDDDPRRAGFGRGHGGAFGPGYGRRRGGFGLPGYRAHRGQLRASILALLAEEPRNGYQIMNAIADKTAGAWTPSPGALYPALAQMADEGLIAEQSQDGSRVYELTEAGRAEAARQPAEPWSDAATLGQANREQRHGLWNEFRLLGATIRLAAASAAPAQLDEIAQGLAAQRRAVLNLLGRPAETPPPSEA